MKNNTNVQAAMELRRAGKLPAYLTFDDETFSGTLVRVPQRSEIPVVVKDSAIVEFYAR
jgi:ribosomal protein S4